MANARLQPDVVDSVDGGVMARRSWDVAFRDMSALHWLSAAANREPLSLSAKTRKLQLRS